MFCECTDKLCPVHEGSESCSNSLSKNIVRIDMEDITGTDMCEDCAEDALASGIFTIREAKALNYDCERHGKGNLQDCPTCQLADSWSQGNKY